MKQDYLIPKFGDIFYASLTGGEHIQSGIRPVVIGQNNIGNTHSPTVEVIPMSTKIQKAKHMPTHVLVMPTAENGLKHASIVLAEQVVTISKKDLLSFVGHLSNQSILEIGVARCTQSPFFIPQIKCS